MGAASTWCTDKAGKITICTKIEVKSKTKDSTVHWSRPHIFLKEREGRWKEGGRRNKRGGEQKRSERNEERFKQVCVLERGNEGEERKGERRWREK